jgi:hypothetical protein
MKIAYIGHSHINCIARASRRPLENCSHQVECVRLRNPAFLGDTAEANTAAFGKYDHHEVRRSVTRASQGAFLAVLCPTGNEYVAISLLDRGINRVRQFEQIGSRMANYRRWLAALARYARAPAAVIPPPPPIESESYLLSHAGKFAKMVTTHGVAPALSRLQAWLHQQQLIQAIAADCGVRFIELPAAAFSERGFLNERFLMGDPTHANDDFGELIIRHVAALAFGMKPAPNSQERVSRSETSQDERPHPYAGLPDRAFWKHAVAGIPVRELDPVASVPFRIRRRDQVASAGSCFAQHISKRIKAAGFQFLVTENAPEEVGEDHPARAFYDFSARYGNIYTARQLVQLFDRAFGYFSPIEGHWKLKDGRVCDPFRPRIEPDGFATVDDLVESRRRHLAAVREMFERLDVFVFTLGLTECWISRLDGAAYPLAPGVAGGTFDPAKHAFVNFDVDSVVSDLRAFIDKLRLVNSRARLVLTVSPVPLVATFESSHVLVSTTYSKSVLRVAAETISRSAEGVSYFPSFEIIAGNYNRGRYFGPDLRSVTQEGVDHVMAVFMRHLTEDGDAIFAHAGSGVEHDEVDAEMAALAEAACDEELLKRD